MVKQIFFIKEGRKYKAISEYDQQLMDGIGYGDHLLSVYPGGSSRRPIVPGFAPVIAATRYSRDVIAKAIRDASDMRPKSTPITEGQRRAWKKLEKEFGDDVHCLMWPAACDAADAAGEAMQAEAEKMLQIPAVRNAYDQFMMVYKLTKDTHG